MAVEKDNYYIMWEQFFIINTQTSTFNMLPAPSLKPPHIPTGGYQSADRWGSRWITTALTFAFNMLQEANLDIAPML